MKYIQNMSWYKNNYLNGGLAKEEAPHYSFYFQKKSLTEKDIKNIIDIKEGHYKKILNWLDLSNNRKIDYYLYPSLKEKITLMGDDSPGNAIWEELEIENGKSDTKKFEIHVVYNEKCKFIGEHEDAHLLSLPWGLSIYLFCEGLSQYMEDNFMGEDLHTVAKKLLQEDKLYSLEWLSVNNNWENVEPVIIYPQVGSFSKFIIEKYGKDKFRELYQGTSRHFKTSKNLSEIEKIYNKKIDQLESEWIDFLLSRFD
ncbi:MAG: Uncharacterized protein XD85_0077 [Parcubacteria bacterium 34_609]|nr:MAG: Uncharacterized protein XD85_0077 [Parcubacteria bacterium 34_609]KUK99428.1 MAG: Uncharacterized protein XE08_0021 [Parcubacteria bacterium 32_520]